MGFLDGLLGGAVGAEMATVVNGLIAQHGGLPGMVKQLEEQGLGPAVRSWISTGANQAVSGDQLHQALGADTIGRLAAAVGLTPAELTQKLATALPTVIDKLTPAGKLPAA